MKKRLITLFIISSIFVLTPIHQTNAAIQNQIVSTVQIVCPDDYGNYYSGSGTVIDSDGIILTNKHVVTDEYGGLIKFCVIGFINSIGDNPNFYTAGDLNFAEVKYVSTSSSIDAALLYLENPSNKTFPYIDIWHSDSDSLKFGDKIEVIGFPSIGGSTMTYTSGDFSGFGNNSDGTQNYIKTTAPIEHGNSGGSAYNSSGEFIGIPTMVVVGSLNSLSYLLSINSITEWLFEILGNNYQEEVTQQEPVIDTIINDIQSDITPPNFNNIDQLCYNIYNNNSDLGTRCFSKNLGKVEEFNDLQFVIFKNELAQIDSSGLKKVYYYFDTKPHTEIGDDASEYSVTDYGTDRVTISDRITIEETGTYYFSFFAVDNNNNVSSPIVYEYTYEPNNFKDLEVLYFYKDTERKDFIDSFNIVDEGNSDYRQTYYGAWGYGANICYTNQKNLTISWEYPTEYNDYLIKEVNSYNLFPTKFTDAPNLKTNVYSFKDLSKGKQINYQEYIHDEFWKTGSYYELYLKPGSLINTLEYKHRLLQIVYNASLEKDLECIVTSTLLESGERQEILDLELINNLKGYILLQVEQHGEAWYVNPTDGVRYYMKDGSTAYQMMRNFSLGITDADLNKIPSVENTQEATTAANVCSSNSIASSARGKILLQVEQHGEAWYVDPDTCNKIYMKDGDVAYTIMRYLSLGITDDDLNLIPSSEL